MKLTDIILLSGVVSVGTTFIIEIYRKYRDKKEKEYEVKRRQDELIRIKERYIFKGDKLNIEDWITVDNSLDRKDYTTLLKIIKK